MPLKKARRVVSIVSKERDKYRSTWQEAATLYEDKFISMELRVVELHELLTRGRALNTRLEALYDLQLVVERQRSNVLHSEVKEIYNNVT